MQLADAPSGVSQFILNGSKPLPQFVMLSRVRVRSCDESQFVHLLHQIRNIGFVLCNGFCNLFQTTLTFFYQPLFFANMHNTFELMTL